MVTYASYWCRQYRNDALLRQSIAMRIPGKRITRTRLIQTEKYVVAVEVEMVTPADDPSEPCYEAETVQLLREIQERAERGAVACLLQKGKVYAPVGAARAAALYSRPPPFPPQGSLAALALVHP